MEQTRCAHEPCSCNIDVREPGNAGYCSETCRECATTTQDPMPTNCPCRHAGCTGGVGSAPFAAPSAEPQASSRDEAERVNQPVGTLDAGPKSAQNNPAPFDHQGAPD